jgi:hypothetical protein
MNTQKDLLDDAASEQLLPNVPETQVSSYRRNTLLMMILKLFIIAKCILYNAHSLRCTSE